MSDPICPGSLCLDDLKRIWLGDFEASICPQAWNEIEKGRAMLEAKIAQGETIYGVNTGFGKLANTKIQGDQLSELQVRLVHSHATGVGPFLSIPMVRLILWLKVNALAQGYSGVRTKVVDFLLTMIQEQIWPLIPAKGSVGASGDLAPLAHLSLALIGEGQVSYRGKTYLSAELFRDLNIDPLVLEAKEGLALLNGTQVSTAMALDALFKTERLIRSALITGSLSVEATLSSHTPFDPKIHRIRGQRGQIYVADLFRKILNDSEIHQSHAQCGRVQDPYSLRCQPQVMGAVWDAWTYASQILLREANGVSDNPLVFGDQREVLSGGNFHGEPVAFAADHLALCIAEMGALSERRIDLLMDTQRSQLPPFLAPQSGLNSGFMIAHVTAASLASANKSLAHPASVDSLSTSAGQEDHVSMSARAAWRLQEMIEHTATILAIEWLASSTGIELRRPLRTSQRLEEAIRILRTFAPPYLEDRYFKPEIDQATAHILRGTLSELVQ